MPTVDELLWMVTACVNRRWRTQVLAAGTLTSLFGDFQ